MTGYSSTPLDKKLGFKDGFRVLLIDPPPHYLNLLGQEISQKVLFVDVAEHLDLVHLFVNTAERLETQLAILKTAIKPNGIIWVSWYKKSAKLPTELTEDVIRDTALALGLVDVKVCAVDDQWSGLKLVIRLKDRKQDLRRTM
ncbi:DUF3052 family protein [Larkinella rosea]|uniref:DUF3052 family protein n=1 Tax=Larkinella rosea TaxID=2025312 RepID=A0A3P1BVN3_9BACT|nr:DUF3052 family protein [Larkinella rosea]RRB04886.1 DUF3052 family protein [Larkinella rosea]